MDWTAGYITELGYIHGHYRELSPGLLRLACLSAGVAPPSGKPLRYLELGFGQGLSLNIHAAANSGEFWGTDFNPTQVAHARALADASGSGVVLLDDSFAEFAARADLPEFDIIALHGVWSWISEENSRYVVDIIRRRLRVGGVLYISYNCQPGWAPILPVRHLLKLYADLSADATGMRAKLDGALGFVQQMMEAGALYFRANPAAGRWLKEIVDQNPDYLAHEYLNEHWRITTFSEMAKCLDGAKLSFVASANLLDHVEALNVTAEGHRFLTSVKHPTLRQSVRDYLVNQQFRRDIFMKGPRVLSTSEQEELWMSESFILAVRPEDVQLKVKGALGEVGLREEVYGPLLQALAQNDYSLKTVNELTKGLDAVPREQLLQAILVLVGTGQVLPAQVAGIAEHTQCRALNRYLFERARSDGKIEFLASPISGGGVFSPRFDQLFLLAQNAGGERAEEQVAFVWNVLQRQGQRIVKDGQELETAEANISELTDRSRQFCTKRLPILKALDLI